MWCYYDKDMFTPMSTPNIVLIGDILSQDCKTALNMVVVTHAEGGRFLPAESRVHEFPYNM